MGKIIHKTTIDILRYVLTGEAAKITQGIDFNELYTFSKSHGVENMIYVGLRDMNVDLPDDIMAKFRQAYEIQIMVEATQALELEAIGRAFEETGIDYIPLKGSVIKYLYPMPDYRKSGDIDILIREKDQKKADLVMRKLSFEKEKDWEEHDVHAIYKKAPFTTVEIHKRLVSAYERGHKLCDKVWENANPDDDSINHYRLNKEFTYVYLLSHMCKHLYYGGAGIRMIMDLYLVKKKLNPDNNVLTAYLDLADLNALENMLCPIYESWFGTKVELKEESRILEQIILSSGSYGTEDIRKSILSSDNTWGKLRRFRRQILPSREWLEMRYSKLKEKNYPLIYMWLYSIVYIIKEKRHKIPIYIADTFATRNRNKKLENIVDAIRIK